VTGDLIYVTSGTGVLNCFKKETGEKVWSVDMISGLNGRLPYHGHAESPLIIDDKVILVVGGTDINVAAFNRFSGKMIWTCKGKGEVPGYNSPILIKLPARSVIVTFSSYHLLGIDAADGKLLWTHEQVNTPVDNGRPVLEIHTAIQPIMRTAAFIMSPVTETGLLS
jgi:outer membrane protein assembly factor BamB